LAGSHVKALLEGDYSSHLPINQQFIRDITEISIFIEELHIKISLLEGLKDLLQEMRGHLSHLKQAEIGEKPFFNLLRWPYRESQISYNFIKSCIPYFKTTER
jgi:hypothetical protein